MSYLAIVGANALKTGRFGEFSTVWMCGQGLHNSTVGIVGLGRIGLAVAKRLVPFGVARIIYTSRQPKDIDDVQAEFVSMGTLLADSDFIVVCCSLTPETMGLFDRAKFARMKRNAIFVNVSRGSVVVQPDLEEALRSGQIAAAGLDVTSPEPLPTDSALLTMPNCVVLPHIGSATMETRYLMLDIAVGNLLAVLNDQPMPAQVTAPKLSA